MCLFFLFRILSLLFLSFFVLHFFFSPVLSLSSSLAVSSSSLPLCLRPLCLAACSLFPVLCCCSPHFSIVLKHFLCVDFFSFWAHSLSRYPVVPPFYVFLTLLLSPFLNCFVSSICVGFYLFCLFCLFVFWCFFPLIACLFLFLLAVTPSCALQVHPESSDAGVGSRSNLCYKVTFM